MLQYGSALSVESSRTIMKLNTGQSAFNHLHVLAIPNNVSDEIILAKKKSVVGLCSKQFL